MDSRLSDEDIANWMAVDSSDSGYQLLTDEEIVQQVVNPEDETEDTEDDEVQIKYIITNGQAAYVLEKCTTGKTPHHHH